MILIDTSVWIEHFNRAGSALSRTLSDRLEEQSVLMHPFVIGELALGNLRHRNATLSLLRALPAAAVASHAEVLRFIEDRAAFGSGIGYVDAHLLAATALTSGASLWTKDKKLREVAYRLSLASMD